MSYCDYCKGLESENVNKIYHDFHYGFPIDSDNELFGRLILEINQAGLSWNTILNKEKNFRSAFDDFDIVKIAGYKDEKINELLNNNGIIRNKLKINAVIYNANRILEIQKEFGSFINWLDAHDSLNKSEWLSLFKKHFKFVGGEIVGEFLMSTGYLFGAHSKKCPIFDKTIASNPNWLKYEK